MVEIPQLKKIKDSYKLLSGKYPSFIHRINKVKAKNKLLVRINALPILKTRVFFGIYKLIQYVIIAKNNKRQANIGNW